MAKILIVEPSELVRGMLERAVQRLGHEPVNFESSSWECLAEADLVIVEPAAPAGAALAQAVSIAVPAPPLIAASIGAPPVELEELGAVFVARLVKPYTFEQLREAIDAALARPIRARRRAWWRPEPPRQDRAA